MLIYYVEILKIQEIEKFVDSFNPDPNIRNTLVWLALNGWKTVDFGDGKKIDVEFAFSVPHVIIKTKWSQLINDFEYFKKFIKNNILNIEIELSYSTKDDIALIILEGDGLLQLNIEQFPIKNTCNISWYKI